MLREGYDVGLLNDGFRGLTDALNLDILMIDTHPGLNEETLLSIAISDALGIIMRPDQQDYQGTGVTVEIARKLRCATIIYSGEQNSADVQRRRSEGARGENV